MQSELRDTVRSFRAGDLEAQAGVLIGFAAAGLAASASAAAFVLYLVVAVLVVAYLLVVAYRQSG